MNRREARRLAIRNIIDVVASDISNGADHWSKHPYGGMELRDSDAAKVVEEAKRVLALMEPRALPRRIPS